MPAARVTLRAAGSSRMTLAIVLTDRKECALSAIVLKQWRVPSTFRFGCFTTRFLTCSTESAENNCSVLYWTLPAQLVSLSPNAQESKVESTGVSVNMEHSLRNIRLVTEVNLRSFGGGGTEMMQGSADGY